MAQILFRHGGYWRWSAGAQLARVPVAMAPLAFTAATTALTGSYATGGGMVATAVIAEVICAVPVGRALDRLGIAREARVLLLARGFAYLGLLLAVTIHLPPAVLIALAAVPGAFGGGVLGGFRTLLTGVVGAPLLTRAVAVNAMIVEAIIVTGPVLVGVLTLAFTAAPMLAMAAASMLAAIFLPPAANVAAPSTAAGTSTMAAGGLGRLLRPLAGWAAAAFALGHVTSTVEVAALPLAQRLGAEPPAASLLVAALSIASVLGGLAYAASKRDGGPRTATVLLTVLAAGSAIVALGRGWPVALAGVVLTGICAAPLGTIDSVRAEGRVPAHRRAEGFALLSTLQGLGFGAGSLSLSLLPLPAVGLLGSASALLALPLLLRQDRPTTVHHPPTARSPDNPAP